MATTQAEEIVEAIAAINGSHPGYRALHAKGTVCSGRFRATPEASRLSRATHLGSEEVEATIRFSNASGNPRTKDANPIAGRGMAVKFHLPDGEATDIVGVPLPVFMVRTPEDFLAFTRVRTPDPETGRPDPEALGAFVAEHPETAAALQIGLPALAPTTSYATSEFNALHAFALVDGAGQRRWGRYGWRPEAGVERVDPAALETLSRDYLQEEIRERLAASPAAFELQFTLAAKGDSLEDPTAVWEGEREVVGLGRLELIGVIEDPERDGPMVFDPMRLTDGIEPSEDRILQARPPAYSVSIARRTATPPLRG